MKQTISLCSLMLVVCFLCIACEQDHKIPTELKRVSESAVKNVHRLSDAVIPESYRIELWLDPNASSFRGHVDVWVDIQEASKEIQFHGKGLEVSAARLIIPNNEEPINAAYKEVGDNGRAILSFSKPLAAGKARIEIEYEAKYYDGLRGLYRVEEGGDSYLFTQFEPLDARAMYPSFDEPRFKTPYTTVLNVAPDNVAIANSLLVEESEIEGGWTRFRFAETKPISSYLVAIAVGPFDIVEAKPIAGNRVRQNEIPLRGITARGKGQELDYALGTTAELLTVLEHYFDYPYVYDKLDIIAVPNFSAGAMENVGAITYRENLLLFNSESPIAQKRFHAIANAHELAHQWFGNVVTPTWWDDIWLNEAFATWMSYKTVAQWSPADRAELSQLKRTKGAMNEDSLASARQIRQPIKSEDDIVNAFDGITYSKGAALLSMYESFLGEQVFRDAMRYHIETHEFASADVYDLIESIEQTSGSSIKSSLESFIFQPGMPVIDFSLSCEKNNIQVKVKQSKYVPLGRDSSKDTQWHIPFCMKYPADGEQAPVKHCEMLREKSDSFVLRARSCPQWIHPNPDFKGYYKWRVDEGAYKKLTGKDSVFTVLDEMAVIESIERATKSGQLDLEPAIIALLWYERSRMPEVSLAPIALIKYFHDRVALSDKDRQTAQQLALYMYSDIDVAQVFDPKYMAEFQSDSWRLYALDVARFRATIGQEKEARKAALDRVVRYLESGASDETIIDSSARQLALEIAVQDGGKAVIDRLVVEVSQSRDAEWRDQVIKALAHATEEPMAEFVRSLAFNKDLRPQEIRTLLLTHVTEPKNQLPTWSWLQANYDQLIAAMPIDHHENIPSITGNLCTADHAMQVQAFLGPRMKKVTGGRRNLDKAVENIQLCSARVEHDRSKQTRLTM